MFLIGDKVVHPMHGAGIKNISSLCNFVWHELRLTDK